MKKNGRDMRSKNKKKPNEISEYLPQSRKISKITQRKNSTQTIVVREIKITKRNKTVA